MMLMREAIEITITINPLDRHQSWPLSIELFFNKQPTKKQVVEATRHFLTDQEYDSRLALAFMGAVRELKLASVNNMAETDDAVMFNNTILFFEIL